jgi:hypothetical protein
MEVVKFVELITRYVWLVLAVYALWVLLFLQMRNWRASFQYAVIPLCSRL